MATQIKKITKTNNLEESLVYEDKLKLGTLETTLKVRPTGAYLALIGVDSDKLLNSFKNYLTTFENTKIFHYKTEQIIDEIIASNENKTFIVDIFNLPDNFDIKNIIQHFRFNRDFIPDKNLRLFILASNNTLDMFSQKAYDFVTFNNFYGKFKDSKFYFEYKVNREKLDRLIKEYRELKPNAPKKIQIEKMISIIREADKIGEIRIVFKYLKIALSKVLKLNNDSLLGAIYTAYGKVYSKLENYKMALEYDHKAKKIAIKIKDLSNEAILLNNLGSSYNAIQDNEKAMECYQQAILINESLNNKSNLVMNYMNLGSLFHSVNDYDNSIMYYEKSLEIAEEIDEKNGILNNLYNIGNIYLDKYQLNKALDNFQKSLKMAKDDSNLELIVGNLLNIGVVNMYLLNFELALKYFNEALILSKNLNDEKSINRCNTNILEINTYLMIENDFEIKIYKDSDIKEDQIRYLIYEANILNEEEKYKESKEKLQQAEHISDEINLKGLQAEVYLAFYDFYRTIDDTQNASKYYNKANYIIKNSGHKLFEKRLEDIKNSHDIR
jgi:tetratricopeptide (TPR) repeat protein